jgi:hypothetical protein
MSRLPKRISQLPGRLLPTDKATKRIVRNFAESAGLVYFGYVSQQSDEHHIVRGLTVSTRHVDDHYCIGTSEEYDVVFVERTDTVHGRRHVWHIMEFDLKTATDLPHVFIGSGKHGQGFHELISTKYAGWQAVKLGATAAYPAAFNDAFTVYLPPAKTIEFEMILPPAAADMFGTYFKGLVVEVTEQALYLYSERPHVSQELLQTMLTNGLWLARTIDLNSRSL